MTGIERIISAAYKVAARSGHESFLSWCDNEAMTKSGTDFNCDPDALGGFAWADITQDLYDEIGYEPDHEAMNAAMLHIATAEKYGDDCTDPHYILGKLARDEECRLADDRQGQAENL
jgi:hypothetical protein